MKGETWIFEVSTSIKTATHQHEDAIHKTRQATQYVVQHDKNPMKTLGTKTQILDTKRPIYLSYCIVQAKLLHF